MNPLLYVRHRLRAMISQIEELEQSEFPYSTPRRVLGYIKGWCEDLLESETELGPKPSADVIMDYANKSLLLCEKYLPILGFVLRSTNIRNGFELFGPLRRIADSLLSPERAETEQRTPLILSSEWDYMPMFRMASTLPGFVMIGLPANESSNPLLFPLCGHELGHALWGRGNRDSDYFGKLRKTLAGIFNAKWQEIVDVVHQFKDTKKPPVQGELSAESFAGMRSQAEEWAALQAEEVFCDFVGVRLFGRAYFLAFAHLLLPGNIGKRLPGYPNVVPRVRYMLAAMEAYGFEKDDLSSDLFEDRPDWDMPAHRVLLRFADEAVSAVINDLVADVDKAAERGGVAFLDKGQVDKILAAFRYVVPPVGGAGLADILNAGWRVFEDDGFWKEYDHIYNDKARVLRDLLLKSIELIEVEEIRIEMEKRHAAANRSDS